MNYTPQIVDTFRSSPLERIMVIDDAYDPPEFDPQFGGDLLDILSAADLRNHVSEDLLGEAVREAAIEALNRSDLENSAISRAAAGLYHVFVDGRAASVDPGGVFDMTKAPALGALDPLVELLRRCQDEPTVVRTGKNDALATARDLQPDLIFMDFILAPPGQTVSDIADDPWSAGGTSSITLLTSILSARPDNVPAVVLMSSEDVANHKAAYFRHLEGQVMGLRFGFLHKGWVTGCGQELTASGDAADVLMDTSGSVEFGRALESALKAWKCGAEKALQQLHRELREFDVKDFAYLLRFRLYEEGEPFADYLEWLMGESLRAIVDDEVDWRIDEFTRLNDTTLTSAIEGAHPFPSDRLARFFHRMRFSSRAARPRSRFSLGDVFVSADHKRVRMVVSPDCDLVPRSGKHAAKRILTIGGSLCGLQEEHAWAGDLIYDGSPKVVKWKLKDLLTHEFESTELSRLRVNGKCYTYFVSMHPMSAQAIQKSVLADMSRVGLPVPPTVNVGAPVKVYLKKKVGNQGRVEEIEGLKGARVQVFMPRGGRDRQKRILFTPRFHRELLAKLQELAEDDLLCDHRGHWRNWIADVADVKEAMLRNGLKLPGRGIFEVVTSIDERKGKSWLEIVVEVSEEARSNMQEIDPLAF